MRKRDYLLLHIVRSGETIRMIADNYQCEVSDISSNNLHITDFKNLKAGMKLKIPFLTRPIIETLEETESFIQDYYPNLVEKFKKSDKEEIINEEVSPIPESLAKVDEQIKEEKKVLRENNVFNNYIFGMYTGNIVPQIPEKYIKKI